MVSANAGSSQILVAISREALNHVGGGGSMVRATVWDHGTRPKTRKVDSRLIGDFATMAGPGFLDCSWSTVDSGGFFSFNFLIFSLRWPVGEGDLGKFGDSYLEILSVFERWLVHRLYSAHSESSRPISLLLR